MAEKISSRYLYLNKANLVYSVIAVVGAGSAYLFYRFKDDIKSYISRSRSDSE